MSDFEAYVVLIGRRKGKRYAERKPLNVPTAAATGNFEDLSDRALRDLITDLTNEQTRRFLA